MSLVVITPPHEQSIVHTRNVGYATMIRDSDTMVMNGEARRDVYCLRVVISYAIPLLPASLRGQDDALDVDVINITLFWRHFAADAMATLPYIIRQASH